jgi:hypothetical protein
VVTAKAKGPVRAKCLIAIFEDPSNLDMKVYIRNNLHHRGLLYPTDRSSKTDLVKKPKRKVCNGLQRGNRGKISRYVLTPRKGIKAEFKISRPAPAQGGPSHSSGRHFCDAESTRFVFVFEWFVHCNVRTLRHEGSPSVPNRCGKYDSRTAYIRERL